MLAMEILEKMRVREKGAYHTHLTMGSKPGCYDMFRNNRDAFFEAYCQAIVENKQQLCILEKPQSFVPVLADIDIKLPLGSKLRYTEYQVESLVRDYQEVLKSILNDFQEEHLICFVLEKESYDTENNTKNGFHLHFPYVFLSKSDQENHLIPRVKNLVKKSNIFSSLGFEDSSVLIDACHTKNAWLMYGSSKDEKLKPYLLTKIYNHDREIISLKEALRHYHIYDTDEEDIKMTDKEEYYLPRVLSTSVWSRQVSEVRPNLPSVIKINIGKETFTYNTENDEPKNTVYNNDQLNQLNEKLKLVKKERFIDMSEWFKLLCLMKGRGLQLKDFIQYSKDSGYSNFSEESCNEYWYKLEPRENGLGMTCVNKWLEEDGIDWKSIFCPKKEKMISSLLNLFFSNMGMLSDKDIAEVFYENYNDSLYSTPIGWLHYNDIRGWEVGDDDSIIYPLMKCIGEKFNKYVQGMKKKDNEEDKDFVKRQRGLLKETNRLCSYSACNKIIKTAKTLFKNETILKEFDLKYQWFCFSNKKAVDMSTGAIIDIKKEDHILTTCGYPLPTRIDKDVEDAKKIVLSIFGSERYDSYTSMLAYQFQSGNPQQNVFIQTGSASNGKSILGNMMRNSLGLYAGILPIDQLTQNASGRDTANSAMANMRGKRYCQLNEPEDDNTTLTLKVARVKELSGESEISVRQLHQQATMMRVDFTMSILCNEIPKLSKNDGGVERRIKVITYPYKFVDEPIESFHRQRDDNIKTRSESDKALHYGFFWLMMDIFKKTQGKFIISDDIKKDSAQYMKENNPIGEFMDKYEPSSENEKPLKQKVIYDKYKEYCKYNNKDSVSGKKFSELLLQLKIKVVLDDNNGNKVYVKEKPIVYEREDLEYEL